MQLVYFYEDDEIGTTVDRRDTENAVLKASEFRQITRSKVGTLELDALIEAKHVSEVELTDHPIEDGAVIADHKRKKPRTLTLEGIVSDRPVNYEDYDEIDGRPAEAFVELERLQDGDQLLTVVTAKRTYENMAVLSIEVPENAQVGAAFKFTAVLREVFTATSKTVENTPPPRPKKTDLGKKPTAPADEPKKQSLLKKAQNAAQKKLEGIFGSLGL